MTQMWEILTLNTWIIADTHFGHKNIVKYCDRPENHDDLMLANWQRQIWSNDDVVLHLGDVAFARGASEELLRSVRSLPGEKYVLQGNHDKTNILTGLGYEIVEPFTWHEPKDGIEVEFVHDPADARPQSFLGDMLARHVIVIHGHIHNNGYPPSVDERCDFRNVSIEEMNYEPVRLRDILYGGKYQSRKDAGVNSYYARS